MKKEEFELLVKHLQGFFHPSTIPIFVGSEIYEDCMRYKAETDCNYNFIKLKVLKDKFIITTENTPLSCSAVSIVDLVRYCELIKEIKTKPNPAILSFSDTEYHLLIPPYYLKNEIFLIVNNGELENSGQCDSSKEKINLEEII